MLEPFAIVKNGMYDDPAVSSTGRIAKAFQQACERGGLGAEYAPNYLTWRYCYLLCGLVFLIAQLGMSYQALDFNSIKAEYDRFLSQAGTGVEEADYFNTLTTALAAYEVSLSGLAVLSLLLLILSVLLGSPCFVKSGVRQSRKVLWAAWLITFVPPFLFTLVVPLRSLVPWDTVVADVCTTSIKQVLQLPGSTLASRLQTMRQQGVITENDPLFSLQGIESLESWCVGQGRDWHDSFYGSTVQCVWHIEASCRKSMCQTLPVAQLPQCLPDCINYVFTNFPQAPAFRKFKEEYESCKSSGGPPRESSPLKMMATMPPDLSKANAGQMFEYTISLQQYMVEASAETATLVTLQAEYVVGVLVGTVLGKVLISAALSLLGGLAEALSNVKAVFPGSPLPGWILVLTTSEALPLYTAILGIFNQTFGGGLLSLSCFFAACYVGLGIFTGKRMLSFKGGDEERERFYKLLWVEMFVRAVVGIGIIASAGIWLSQNDRWGVTGHIREFLLRPDFLAAMVVQFFARKIMTAVAGTDAVLCAFVGAEWWRSEHLTGPGLEKHNDALRDLKGLETVGSKGHSNTRVVCKS